MAKRILVVDDDPSFTALLRSRLEAKGYEVEESWSGGDAQKKISDGTYDLALIDYSMPSLKGDELCKLLKDEEKSKLPVIIVTAFTNRDPGSFKDIGASDVIYKPLDDEELLDKIAKHVNQG